MISYSINWLQLLNFEEFIVLLAVHPEEQGKLFDIKMTNAKGLLSSPTKGNQEHE
jgi:hypothetical protein